MTTTETYVMPFGRHKGEPITAVPTAYLEICARRGCYVGPPAVRRAFLEAVETELARRTPILATTPEEARAGIARATRDWSVMFTQACIAAFEGVPADATRH